MTMLSRADVADLEMSVTLMHGVVDRHPLEATGPIFTAVEALDHDLTRLRQMLEFSCPGEPL